MGLILLAHLLVFFLIKNYFNVFQITKEIVKKEDETATKKKVEVVEIQVSSENLCTEYEGVVTNRLML